MKSVWKYILIFLVVFVLALCVALPLFGMRTFGGMRMHAFPSIGMRVFPFHMGIGWLGMGFHFLPWLLVLLGLAALAVVVVVLLLRKKKAATAAVAPAAIPPAAPSVDAVPCAHCGQPLQPGWVACPFCGAKVGE